MKSNKAWIEQCEAAKGIEDEFGTQKALAYLIGEKFINFLEAAEDDAEFRIEIPIFVAEVKKIFERWQVADYLERARMSETSGPRCSCRLSPPHFWARRSRSGGSSSSWAPWWAPSSFKSSNQDSPSWATTRT